jgi:hypothetical protein
VLDPAGQRLLLVDTVTAGLLSVDLRSGSRRPISDAMAGGGPRFRNPVALAADLANDRVFAADGATPSIVVVDVEPAIFSVDLVSGDRTVISDNAGKGAGPMFAGPHAMLHDATHRRLLVLDDQRLLSVDLETGSGNRLVLSDGTRSGPALSGAGGLAFGSTPNTVLVAVGRSLVSIDLVSGDRAYVTEAQPTPTDASGLLLDGASWFAFVSSDPTAIPYELTRIEIATGATTVVSGAARGKGPMAFHPFVPDLQATLINRVALVTSAGYGHGSGAVYAIDTVSGDRLLLSM